MSLDTTGIEGEGVKQVDTCSLAVGEVYPVQPGTSAIYYESDSVLKTMKHSSNSSP